MMTICSTVLILGDVGGREFGGLSLLFDLGSWVRIARGRLLESFRRVLSRRRGLYVEQKCLLFSDNLRGI